MNNNNIEVEIKALLGEKVIADKLRERLQDSPFNAVFKKRSVQLNHYFVDGNMEKVSISIGKYLNEDNRKKLNQVLTKGKNHSVRTRSYKDGKAFLVIKASIDDTTSANGLARIEFEELIPGITLEELDQILIEAGLRYQAKWSREREEYVLTDGTTVCLDKNAGYGYLAEFERVVEKSSEAIQVKQSLRELMRQLKVEELSQDRLERMFAYYNEHWPEYYGTDKTFVVE